MLPMTRRPTPARIRRRRHHHHWRLRGQHRWLHRLHHGLRNHDHHWLAVRATHFDERRAVVCDVGEWHSFKSRAHRKSLQLCSLTTAAVVAEEHKTPPRCLTTTRGPTSGRVTIGVRKSCSVLQALASCLSTPSPACLILCANSTRRFVTCPSGRTPRYFVLDTSISYGSMEWKSVLISMLSFVILRALNPVRCR